ncbi:hypothetical protein DFH09DRAFT_985746 [Mycena vulgaris]|nr:hypothetical protein DFH09DRAFT_1060624 [Mycena vulgaris]KAJ6560606.1 hypothetical protein DFH09DRAFT_985746 [Mycena vulgaris]
MEALQMLKFSIKKGRTLNFTAGTSREEEIRQLESEMVEKDMIPEDVTGFSSYIQSLLDKGYDSDDH